MVAERGTEMTEWKQGRLDDLGNRVDRIETKMDAGFVHIDRRFTETDQKMEAGFARIGAKFDEFFLHMDAKFDVVNQRFENMHQMLFRSAWALVIGLLGMFSVLIGVIATQS